MSITATILKAQQLFVAFLRLAAKRMNLSQCPSTGVAVHTKRTPSQQEQVRFAGHLSVSNVNMYYGALEDNLDCINEFIYNDREILKNSSQKYIWRGHN